MKLCPKCNTWCNYKRDNVLVGNVMELAFVITHTDGSIERVIDRRVDMTHGMKILKTQGGQF